MTKLIVWIEAQSHILHGFDLCVQEHKKTRGAKESFPFHFRMCAISVTTKTIKKTGYHQGNYQLNRRTVTNIFTIFQVILILIESLPRCLRAGWGWGAEEYFWITNWNQGHGEAVPGPKAGQHCSGNQVHAPLTLGKMFLQWAWTRRPR